MVLAQWQANHLMLVQIQPLPLLFEESLGKIAPRRSFERGLCKKLCPRNCGGFFVSALVK